MTIIKTTLIALSVVIAAFTTAVVQHHGGDMAKHFAADIAIRNLVENAARYTTSGGAIQVQQIASGLNITNECEVPDGSDSERLFEPFERSATGGGNGLGLAVCRAAAKANGWTISARFESGLFVVNLTC